ncbi:WG repeat-containing protein [uncultured Flavonifractor sp.]|uniref:WG repeat-containing protein n=1 Tax=uncultured Flavonifractor sp. TaxID=1193534 RepID=UPI0026373EF8|nr:WG repeat-containing protein [uncultured Flavonifractor sp.]
MRLNRQLLASLLLTALLLTGLLPGAAAAELSASYEPANYYDIAVTVYSRTLLFQDGVVAASDVRDHYGLIDVTGAVRVPFQYDYLEATGGGYFVVTQGSQQGIMDCSGQFVVPLAKQSISTRNNILHCWSWSEDGISETYYTEDMQPADEADYYGDNSYLEVEGYYYVLQLAGGFYLAYGYDGMAILGSDFQPTLPIGAYSSLKLLGYVGETPYFQGQGEDYGSSCVVDPYGRVIIPMGAYSRVGGVSPSGKLAVQTWSGENCLSQLYDLSTGAEVRRWTDRGVTTETYFRDLAFTLDGEKYGTMDEDGNVLVPNQFYMLLDSGSLDYVKVVDRDPENQWATLQGLYTADGQEVFAPQFREMTYLGEDDYRIYDGAYFGVVDGTGAFPIPAQYRELRIFNRNFLEAVNDSGGSLVLDVTGREVIPQSLENMYIFDDYDAFEWNSYTYETLPAREDGYKGAVLPFRVKTGTGYETYYVDWQTGQCLGWLPVLASNLTSDGRFVYRDESNGLYGFGRLDQGVFPQNPDAPDSGLPEEEVPLPDYLLESVHDFSSLDGPLTYTYTYPEAQALDVTFSPYTDVALTLNGRSYAPDDLAGQTVRVQGDTLTAELAGAAGSGVPLFGFAVEQVEPVGGPAAGPGAAAVYTAGSGSGAEAVLTGLRSGEAVEVTLVGQGTETRCLLGAIYGADGAPLDFAVVPVTFDQGIFTASLDFSRYGQAVTLKLFLMDGDWVPEMVNLTLTDAG